MEPAAHDLADVTGAVWLAAAALAFLAGRHLDASKGNYSEDHFAFRQEEIRRLAQQFCAKKVHSPRVHQWTNADHDKSTYSYLRAVGSKRRLTIPGECGGRREEPPSLLPKDAVVVRIQDPHRELTFGQLHRWVHEAYPKLVAPRPTAIGRATVHGAGTGNSRSRVKKQIRGRRQPVYRPDLQAQSAPGRLYQLLALLPRLDCTTPTGDLPKNGIYVFYERGEEARIAGWTVDRVVRIGTHRGDGNFPSRIRQHFGNRSDLGGNKNSSVFRKHVGGAILRRRDPRDERLEPWLTQDGPTFAEVEHDVSENLGQRFSFACFEVPDKEDRLALERGMIGLLSEHPGSRPSPSWLGAHAADAKIVASGLWNSQHTGAAPFSASEFEKLKDLIGASATSQWRRAGLEQGTLVVVPCGSAKVWARAPERGPVSAWEAYTGSPGKVNREYASRFGDSCVVLSAKYGIMLPTFAVPGPYDVTFKDSATGPITRDILEAQTRALGADRFARVIILGGTDYVDALRGPFDEVGANWVAPFLGLDMFQQVAAVKRSVATGDPGLLAKS